MTPPRKASDNGKGRKPATNKPRAHNKSRPAKAAATANPAKAKKARRTLGGPDLKMPSFAKLSFGSGVMGSTPMAGAVGDLRERGLLPVVVLLIAAIVAVPLLLSDGKKAAKPVPAATQNAAAGAGGEQAVVLANQPGVRDYRKRLGGQAKDPFKQPSPSGAAAAGDGALSTGVSEVGVATASAGVPAAGGASTGGADPTATSPAATHSSRGTYVTHTVDLYVGATGGKLKLRRGIFGTVALPNKKNAVAALLGVPIDDPVKAEFLVSDGVQVTGDFSCEFSDDGGCQLLSLKPGEAVKFHDASGRVYALKLVRINPVVHKALPADNSK
ncbi:MAG: hypothetical protein ABR536_02665 [Solirubrobacterales bacterium]